MQGVALAFVACCLVNFLDVLGVQGTNPVLVPYGRSLGATLEEIASFNTTRFAFGMVSMIWMARLADKRGTKFVLLISILGSTLAYLLQGISWHWSQCPIVEVHVDPHGSLSVPSGPLPTSWRGCEELAQDGGSGTWLVRDGEIQPGTWQGSLQCEVECGARDGVLTMQLGRALAGFFGGSMPVLRSWITQVSVHDSGLLKRRLVIMQSAALVAPFTVAPVAGALALLGLHLPWLVAAGLSVLALLYTILCFQNGSKLGYGQQAPAEGKHMESETASTPKPILDPRLHLFAFIYLVMIGGVSGLNLLLPVTLEQPSFRLLDPASVSRSRANVASAGGIVLMPFGIVSLLTSTVLYLLVSSRIGDRNTVRVAICLGPLSLALTATVVTRIWQLATTLCLLGLAVGFFMPAISPLMATYVARSHPAKMAQATALPLMGMQLGFMLGPQLMANIIKHWSLRTAWLTAAGLFTVGLVLMAEVMFRATAPPSVTAAALTRRQSTLAVETKAEPVDKFIELVCADVREMFEPEGPQSRHLPVWNGIAQGAMRRSLREALPSLRPWDEATDGAGHIQDVAAWLLQVGTEVERLEFRELFPSVCTGVDWNLGIGALDVTPALTFDMELQRENSKHSLHSKSSKASALALGTLPSPDLRGEVDCCSSV